MTIKHEQDIQLPAKKKRTGYTTEQEQDVLPLAGLSYLCMASGKFPTVASNHAINYKLRRWAPKENGSIELNLKNI